MDARDFNPSQTERKPRDLVHVLLPRQSACATCPDSTPACPKCPDDQICQVTVPLTCTECPTSYCAANTAAVKSSSKSGVSSSTGAIAGGVIGGVAVIGIVTYLVWRYCIKAKRRPVTKVEEDGQYEQTNADSRSFTSRRDQRASTHTVHSIASTVLTRASNIIQIAYIPGVMNRASPASPTVLVPPVPPIPIGVSSSHPSTPSGTADQHFFVPGDLRDSTYSGYSGFSDRTSYARTSYAPRSSIASTIYGKNAVIVAPPQTGMRIKPTMVNLKSPNNLSPGYTAPPVPNVDFDKYNDARPVSAANSTFSVGSTFLNNASASTAMPARPVVVRVGNATARPAATSADSASEKDDVLTEVIPIATESRSSLASPVRERVSLPPAAHGRESSTLTIIEDSPSPDQGPFSDPPASPSSPVALSHRKTNGLSAVLEEATPRVSQREISSTSAERERSPFSDENATHDI